MNMKSPLLKALGAGLLIVSLPFLYGATSSIWNSVAVCSYANTANCIQPNSDGSINIAGTVTGTFTQVTAGTNGSPIPTKSDMMGIEDGSGNTQPVSSSNPVPISAASLPLPTGGSTSALQTTGNTSLATIATNTTGIALASKQPAIGTAGTPSADVLSVQGVTGGTPVTVSVLSTAASGGDPCNGTKSYADFESGTSGGSIVTAVSAKKTYICSISIITSAAANVSIIEGTGSSVCTGGTPSGDFLNTGTTAANGAAIAANGGIQAGNGGATIFANATANQNTCVAFTTTNSPQVNVHVAYVQQ